jgi:hypothetical protein
MTTAPILCTRQGSASKSHLSLFKLLGAILSVVKDVPVESSAYNPNIELHIIEEEQDDGPLPEDDTDDGSGEYQVARGEGLTLVPQWPVAMTAIVMGTPSLSYWFIHSLADIDHLAHSPTFRLGHISIPHRITCSPFHCALGTINHTYGLPIL